MSLVLDLVKKHEGCKLTVYKDTVGLRTIGYGRCLDTKGITDEEAKMLGIDLSNIDKVGITQTQAEGLLLNDLAEQQKALQAYPFFNTLNESRQAVMVDLRFNLGGGGLSNFKHFLEFMRTGDYQNASAELLNSKWAKQVGTRATEDATIIKTG